MGPEIMFTRALSLPEGVNLASEMTAIYKMGKEVGHKETSWTQRAFGLCKAFHMKFTNRLAKSLVMKARRTSVWGGDEFAIK